MIVEFNIANDEIISLSVVKKENTDNRYQLIDDNKFIWMELELQGQNLSVWLKDVRILDDDESIENKLDNILFEIIEIEKSGADTFNENDSSDINPYDPDKIKVRSDKIAVSILSKMIDNESIDLNPDFQRNLVWNSFQKSRLIESILLRIPLPMFYFAEDEEGNLSVVDGLQRISTIKEFMDNKFPLRNLQYLNESCEGRYYETKGKKKGLDPKYLKWFDLTSISANIIDPSSPSKVKYDIFRRINTGGRPLNNQEIRNCLTGKGLREALKQMVNLSEFKSATDKSIKSTRMEDQEMALRFLNFYQLYEKDQNIDGYTGYMDVTLDEFTDKNTKNSILYFEKYISLFSNAMKNAEYLIGSRYAFRKIQLKDIEPNAYKQLINKALFVCCSILLADYDNEKIKELNEENALTKSIAGKIDNDNQLLYYLSYGTNGRANLTYTFDVLKEVFHENIRY
ncbi:hypothetical protein CMT89_08515 [Elizabethkingia anophelis]|uniref:DUF262 domain-containing protein n=1 Tax=Elizabethkingia anophelis TaxID=1117645 RepID=UPI000CE942AB|nr:DUF262 domain-containing protein [Elizabethkingia anophelis]AVF48291.1 hypothetical protein AL491_09500 [Elizabethkingia anophelis]AVF52285.1 hypothetical protein AL492_11910 [Elizabethkingia anophelis]MBG0505924.1 DUF262 domain-containing protein [Elizabethkingia anophelis]MCT3805323.1 DUF262 domain-containing protein [Elizabethkingia anophelis]MCT3812109.1 DUF262 domain-containing protein [Elizabethkingia anophelis]